MVMKPEVLRGWLTGQGVTDDTYRAWVELEKKTLERSVALGYGLDRSTLEKRVEHFQAIAPVICEMYKELGDEDQILQTLWAVWLPLAEQLRRVRQRQDQPLIQGILGGQGTGKTTLCRILKTILESWGYPCLSLSLDDLYKSYGDRQQLQLKNPQLIWRGPPGTHDVETGISVLSQLQRANIGDEIAVPRFDKSLHDGAGDRIEPELVDPAEIILFEGWFVGCRPINPELFDAPSEPIKTESDRRFAREMNEHLRAYEPLWAKLDRLVVLLPEDYRLSQQWRREAEHRMIAQGKAGMSDAELENFVNYFWRSLHPELFITPLTQNSNLTDLVMEIDAAHRPQRLYRPENPA